MKKCEIQSKCGGCTFLDIPYEKQLINKQQNVKKLMDKELSNRVKVKPTIGMNDPYNYRNKGKYAFKYGKMGFFEEGTHKIVFSKCAIQKDVINDIADYISILMKKLKLSIYNEDTCKGFLRYVVIRYAEFTGNVMVIFVTTSGKMFKKQELVKAITNKFPKVKSIVQNINDRETNAILGNKSFTMYGDDFIIDKINEYSFKISPMSFYQVNPVQMQVLYNTAIEYANLIGDETVYDLYSGIGTISLCVSNKASKVYGIEIVRDAVTDSIENAKLNNIRNVRFMLGKVEDVLPKLCIREKADVIFVDPPRSGLENKTIQTLLKVKPKKIVYISCNPETLAKNLREFENDYDINEIQPVDMFPFTKHVEVITLMSIKNDKR